MIIFDPHYFTTVIDPEILSIGNINLEHIIFIWFLPVHVGKRFVRVFEHHVAVVPNARSVRIRWARSQGGR